MGKILKETNDEDFKKYTEDYMRHLREENETDFLNYLERYQ